MINMKLNFIKHFMVLTILFVSTLCVDYSTRRARMIDLETRFSLGGNTSLTDQESLVNECLMKLKWDVIDNARASPTEFIFSQHFFEYKDKIRQSKLYKIIKAMPKGAVLHIHDMGILGPDYLLNVTYMDNLFICFGNRISFLFAKNLPSTGCDVQWQLMSEARRTANNITDFNLQIRKLFTIVVDNPDVSYPSIKESWEAFQSYIDIVQPLLTYKLAWEQYFYDALVALREENVMYVEVRSNLPSLYGLDGKTYDEKYTAKSYRKALNKFLAEHPDFFGARFIYAPLRNVDIETMTWYLRDAKEISRAVPDIFAGFDLVGPEDMGPYLIDFAALLDPLKELNFFFHAGETNWYGTGSDENLIDAVLLGAKRIGNAFALTKHPAVIKAIVQNDIGVEVNVVSNTVLPLVRDVRNHPLSLFLSLGLPVVLSSDEPGFWEASPLTDDFYVAFLGVASRNSDLRMLRTLGLNSLKYSALDPLNKHKAIRIFYLKWTEFIDKFDCSLYDD